MVDSVITKQELIDAQKDAQTLEDVVNGPSGELIETRLGRQVYTLASIPIINAVNRDEINGLLAPKANSIDVYQKTETYTKLEVDAATYKKTEVFTKSEVTSLVTPKADLTYVDTAIGAISTDASKQYATLALANADIASIALNKNVFISEAVNGGYWYKATAGATSLTKSAYDPLTQAKLYTDLEIGKNNPKNINISLAGLTSKSLTATEAQNKIIYFSDALGGDCTVLFPKQKGIWQVRHQATGGNILLKTIDSAITPITIINGQLVTVVSDGINLLAVGADKAPITNPVLTNPKSSATPSASSNDTSLATTEFARRAANSITEVNVSAGGVVELTTTQMGYPMLRLTGALTADVTLNFPSGIGRYSINNRTTGGFNVILKGFNQSSAFVTLKPSYSESIQLYNGVVSKLITEPVLPIATSAVLGGVKIGAGLTVDADGTLNASGGSGGSVQRFAGKFGLGKNYSVGDVVEHGSGIYQVVVTVTGSSTPPNLSGSYQKIAHNLYSGPNLKISQVSKTTEYTQEYYIPAFMDKQGVYCIPKGARYVVFSTDYGKTHSSTVLVDLGSATYARWIKQTKDGELFICSTTTVSGQPNITKFWKSTGWKGDGTVPTWAVVYQFQRQGIYAADWGFSQHGPFVLITDYGSKASVSGDEYARYCYLSKDYGKTWQTIFDLATVTTGIGVHMHGACFDPYWNRIWISFGDGAFGKNGLLYSDDLGVSWTWALQNNAQGVNFTQSVNIVALPTCILFASDSYPNGIQRIDRAQGRTPTAGYYTVDSAWMIPDQPASLAYLFQQVSRSEWIPDAPYLFVYSAENVTGKSGVVATFDGWSFDQIWISDANNTAGYGGRSVIGVTPTNEVIIGSFDSSNPPETPWQKITIKVNVD